MASGSRKYNTITNFMVNIYKSGISALQFTVEQGKLTSDEAKLSLIANTESDLEILAKNSSIRVTNDAVHIAPKLVTDTAQVSALDTTEVTTTKLTTDEVTTDILEANTIIANNAILYHPLLDDGKVLDTDTVISVHASVFSLYSAVKELKDATDVEYNTVKAATTLLSPGTLDGQRTGVIRNIASISAESLAMTSATVTDLTAVNIAGVDSFEVAQVSADTGVFGNINVSNTITAGTVNASTAISTVTVTSTNATIPDLTTATLRPVSNDTGIILAGTDGYSYLTLNSTGAMVTDTKSVKMVARTLDGKTAGVTMTGDGVTLQENTIIIPNAVSVIHSLMTSTITSDPNYNALKEEVDQLSADFVAAIEDASYPTLPEVPDTNGEWEAVRLTSDYLPLSKLITAISIDALNTNANAPRFLSVYVKLTESSNLQLLGVSDEAVTWTTGEKVTWNFSEPLTFPANTERVEINLIVNKLAPATANNSAKIKSNFLAVTTGGNNNSQRYNEIWYAGRATLITFEQKGTLGKLSTKVEEVTSEMVALQSEVDSLTLTTQSDITALQLDVDRLQDEIDNIEISGGGTGTLMPGEPLSTTLIYGSTVAPKDVQTPQALVLTAEPIFMSRKSGSTYSEISELKYESIAVDTESSYMTISGQADSLMNTLCSHTPLSSPDAFPDVLENLVPTIKQISQNMVFGELGALLSRPVISGVYAADNIATFNNMLPYCMLELTGITSYTRLNASSFSFATATLNDMRSSRVFDLELRLKFDTETPDCLILTNDIAYASRYTKNGTMVTGLLYAGSLKTYSGTLRSYPDRSWILFDNYATFY